MAHQLRKYIAVGLSIGAIYTVGFCTTAYGLPLINNNSVIKGLTQPLKNQLNIWKDYISSKLFDELELLSKSVGEDLQSAVKDSVGVLGLPDPTEAREKIERLTNSSNPNSPIDSTERVTNEIDRQITRAVADTTLGKAGQNSIKEKWQITQNSIEQVRNYSQNAQQEVVTQNVMKQIASQNVQTAQMLGAMRTDILRSHQSQDLANTNLTNISRSVDGQNQARASEIIGQGFSNYRATYKARLF